MTAVRCEPAAPALTADRVAVHRADPPGGRLAWMMWGLAALVYFLALFHRMSLGVAALDAQQRFGVGATALAAFTTLQLFVYLAMQVPAGVLADRLGPRVTLTAGLAAMAVGELAFAYAHTMEAALAARALVGFGDAVTFINVLRIAASWFPARRFPLLNSATGLVGALGQLLATVPLSIALAGLGWATTFAATGLITALTAVVIWFRLRDRPPGRAALDAAEPAAPGPTVLDDIRAAIRTRGVRAGFWVHFTLMGPFVAFGALWGFPYLTGAAGLSPTGAGALIAVGVAAMAVAALLSGIAVTRWPTVRPRLVLATATMLLAVWTGALVWPGGVPPLAYLVLLVTVIGAGGAVAMLGLAMAREDNPGHRSGTAVALVNLGGFSAAVLALHAVGTVLDHVGSGYSASGFRLGFLPLLGLIAIGTAGIVWQTRALPDSVSSRRRRVGAPAVPPARRGR